MNEDRKRVAEYLSGLAGRERGLLLARGLAQWGVLCASALVLVTATANAGWMRNTAVFGLVTLGGCGSWALVVRPLFRQWRSSGDLVRQAKRVEDLKPELRGRLVAVAERLGGVPEGESPVIVERLATKALVTLREVRVGRVHSSRSAGAWAGAAGFWGLVALVGLVLSPMGIQGTMQWWLFPANAVAAVEGPAASGPKAKVGDLVIRYVYPDYTGLEPKEVQNSTGDVHAPPGTRVEVSARSAQPMEAVAVVAYEDDALDGVVSEDGRRLSGSFQVGTDVGFWKFVAYRQGDARPSRDFKIEPEADLPPEVLMDTPSDVLEVALDDRLPLLWRARDDFGISKVIVEIGDVERGTPLASPRERKAEVFGQASPSPRELGLSAGDRVQLTIAAWDNDAVSGSKRGQSRTVQVVVLGASGLDHRADQRQRDLRDALLELLATSLVDPWPPGRTEGALASWGVEVVERYQPLSEWADAWGEQKPRDAEERLERDLVGRVTESGRALVRFTQVAFPPNSGVAPKGDDLTTLATLRDDAVTSVENAILALDRMIQNRAMEEVAETAERLEQVAAEVQAELDSMSAQEMLTRLDQLERELSKLMKATELMQDSGLKEFINQRGQELSQLSDEIRKALEQGRVEEARELMERLARELEDLSKGIQEQFEHGKSKSAELQQQAEELKKTLEALEKEQRDLQERTRELREKGDGKAAERAESIWTQLDRLSADHAAAARRYVAASETDKRPFHELERGRDGVDQSDHLRDAVSARDVRGSRDALEQARAAWESVEWVLRAEGRTGARPGSRELSALQLQLDEMEKLLDQLEATSKVPPETQRQVRDLQQQQQQLQEKLEEAQKQASKVSQGLQTKPEGLQEGLEQAGESMGQANDDLGQGQPMQAEGSQGSAAERIREARESLEQAMRDQQAMSQGRRGKGGEGAPSGKGDEMENYESQPVEIPSPEQFRTPEEYRRELLEGMEGDVPEEYRAMKKRFFEELVNQ